MVASKRILCHICNRKCSGNVLRYQDRYYHKQCFETEQASDVRSIEQQENPITDNNSSIGKSYNTTRNIIGTSNRDLQSPTSSLKNGLQSQPSQANSNTNLSEAKRTSNSQNMARESPQTQPRQKGQTLATRGYTKPSAMGSQNSNHNISSRSATLPHSASTPANGFLTQTISKITSCAGCGEQIRDGQALIALDLHWHVWCFRCNQCGNLLHGEYVAKDGRAYCEKDYQKLYGVVCVYCKRYISGKVLQAGEAHHFHPSCARCSKCGDPFVPGEEMYLQGEVTWHPRCGPGPDHTAPIDESDLDVSSRSQLRSNYRARSPSLSSRSRSTSPFSYMSRQYGRSSPYGYADSEAVGDLSRVYTISYLNADPTQSYLKRPVEPHPPKSPQFSRPTSMSRDRSRSSSRSQINLPRDRSMPRGMYSVLSGMRSSSSVRARSPSMMNEEAIQNAHYPGAQKPSPDAVPKIERDDFPAPPFPYPERNRSSNLGGRKAASSPTLTPEKNQTKRQVQQERASRPRSREIVIEDEDESSNDDPQLKKEEEELSKIANGIGKIFLQTLKEREKLRAWKRANLDPRNASRTPSATRELPSRLRYENPRNASPSRDLDRPRPWDEDEGGDHSPTRTKSSLGRSQLSSSNYGYKVVQSNRSTPKPGYGVTSGPYGGHTDDGQQNGLHKAGSSYIQPLSQSQPYQGKSNGNSVERPAGSMNGSAHLRRSMPNVNQLQQIHQEGPPKLYPYHLLVTSNYRLPPDVDRCHLERHLSNEEFQYIFNCDRLDFYRLPEWKRNDMKRRAKLF